MPKKDISPKEALRIALDSDHCQLYKTYDLSRVAAFLAMLTNDVTKVVNERIQRGEIV